MPTNNRILFMYMVPETGHQKAAEAVIDAASHMDPHSEFFSVDAVNHTYPLISSVFNKMYLQMLKRAPFIWEYLYDNPDVEHATRDARQLLTLMSSFRTKKMLKKYHPAAVVCTQAAPAIAMSSHKRKGHLKVPLIGIVTDYGVHTYWLNQEIDLYLVGHEDVKQEMIHKGIAENKIRVTGIPIRPKFGETMERAEARRRLHLDQDKFTILLMGGSHGLGDLDDLVHSLKSVPYDIQCLVLCGRNRSLFKKISSRTRGSHDFHVLGYMKDTATLMSASDVLITKPGGLTCSEALAKQLPMIVTNPIPGQEERNVRFLTKHHLAVLARNQDEVVQAVTDFVRHPNKTTLMRQRAKLVSKPHSAWEAARLIFDLVNKRGSFSNAR